MPVYRNPPPLDLVAQRLAGKVVFVTGASSGIGAAAVRRFVAEGAQVAAAARRADRLQALAEELGEAVAPVACDVRDEGSVQAAIAETLERFGRLDGAFNNAGVGGAHASFPELSAEAFDRCYQTNLRGVFLCMKHEVPAMLASGGGAIVNTSSIGGLVGGARNSDYAASKWGLAGLTKCVAREYARRGSA